MAWTKEYRAEYMKKYREEHREQLKANRRYYYQRNKKNILQPNPKAAEENNVRVKRHYHSHKHDPEFKKKRNERVKRWIDNNRDRWNAYQREYYRKRKALEGQG
jgi:hypothetical protein